MAKYRATSKQQIAQAISEFMLANLIGINIIFLDRAKYEEYLRRHKKEKFSLMDYTSPDNQSNDFIFASISIKGKDNDIRKTISRFWHEIGWADNEPFMGTMLRDANGQYGRNINFIMPLFEFRVRKKTRDILTSARKLDLDGP